MNPILISAPLLLFIFSNSYCKIASNKVNIKKDAAKTIDNLLNKPSIPFFFPPMTLSAPPEIAPESPADFPDCNKTVAITPIDDNICNTNSSVFNFPPPKTLTY